MKLLLGLAVCASLVATGATAQRIPVADPKPQFDPSGPQAKAKEMRGVVQRFARCLVRGSSAGVEKYLAENMAALPPILGRRAPECLGEAYDEGDGAMMKGQSGTYRVALAEAYVVRKYRGTGLSDLASIAPLVHPGESGRNGTHALGTLSECIIRKAPAESWALLRTDAASSAEAAALASLAPAMQACVTHGTMVKMQAFFMRGAIAETYYKLSQAPRVAAAAGGAR